MRVTLLGTGTPPPSLERSGPSQILQIGDELILIDCGPGTTRQLLKAGFSLPKITTVFFTHHHYDHNAGFASYLLGSWTLGRSRLKVFGPEGTERFVRGLVELYQDDIGYRLWLGRSEDGIRRIEMRELNSGDRFQAEGGGWAAVAQRTRHYLPTLAYRFEAGGKAVVVSGDTDFFEGLVGFARGADILVQDTTMVDAVQPTETDVAAEDQYRGYRGPPNPAHWSKLLDDHCTPEEAATIAARAGVRTLVLTHLMPLRDLEVLKARVRTIFNGRIVVGEDLLTIDCD